MPEYHTRTGFRITPVVGIVTPPFELRADANEVDEIFEVPLAFLLDPANHQRQSREWQGELRWFFAMPYERPLHLGRDRRHAGESFAASRLAAAR